MLLLWTCSLVYLVKNTKSERPLFFGAFFSPRDLFAPPERLPSRHLFLSLFFFALALHATFHFPRPVCVCISISSSAAAAFSCVFHRGLEGGGGRQVGIGAGFDNKWKKNKFICKHVWEATGGGLQIEKKGEKIIGESAFLVIFAWMNLLRRRQWRGEGAGKARN